MNSNFSVALEYVLAEEGGYSNHPKDPGGATNKGVIQRVYNAYRRNKGLTPRSVKLLQADELKDIYKTNYWGLVHGDRLPSGLDYCVFDFAVNSGPSQATKVLQRAINDLAGRNLKVDGIMGEATIDAATSYDTAALVNEVCNDRGTFFKSLRYLYPEFGKGWMARLGRVRPRALAMAATSPAAPMPEAKPVVPAELGGDAQKESKLPEVVTGLSGVAATGLLAVVNNPYALTFALAVLAVGCFYLYRKYRHAL